MKTRFSCFGGAEGYRFFCLLLGLFLLAGCQQGGTEVGNPGGVSLGVRFADDGELESYIKEQFAGAVVVMPGIGGVGSDLPSANGGAGAGGGGEGTRDFSDTNVQEPGVDEADKVKTDGSYLYVAQQDGVRIVQLGAGGAMSVAAKVAAGGPVDSLYRYQSLLVALYHPTGAEGTAWCGTAGAPVPAFGAPAGMPCWVPVQAQTGVLIVDVQDPANPLLLSDRVFDGELVSSRLIGGKLHLVSRFMPELPPLGYYYDGTEAGKKAVVQRNLDALQGISLDELIPSFESRDAAGNVTQGGPLLGAQNCLGPTLPQGGSIVTVTTFDLDRPQEDAPTVGAVLDARQVYASTTALYLAAETWAANGSGQVQTALHKFDLSGGMVAYAASGSVPGSVLNQFSLGEYQNVLRVATTTWSWGNGGANHVYCLRQGEEGLEIVGRLENLAPGERLYAARFMGKRGFLVTFVQIDPLFTLDLADPTAPKVVGELKVPGYSDYIHPLGEDHLLSIGKSVTPDGLFQGVQLSIFDVGDFAHPALLFREEIGDRGTESEALHDHKAFTYWAETGLLAIPVDLYEHLTAPLFPSQYGQHTFSGLYVFRVDPTGGFTFQGRIDTQAGAATGFSYSPWTRGLFAGESVYAVTTPGVFSAQLTDIANTVLTLDISQ